MVETVTITNAAPQPSLEQQAVDAGIDISKVDNASQGQPADLRPTWLPTKFKTPEDMATSYAALERKMSGAKDKTSDPSATVVDPALPSDPVDTTADPANPVVPVVDPNAIKAKDATEVEQVKEDLAKAGVDFNAMSDKFWTNGEKLEDADYATLAAANIPKGMVDQFIAGQRAVLDAQRSSVFTSVGGEDNYKGMIEWAGKNYTPAQVEAYDKAVNSGDMERTLMAVRGLKAEVDNKRGNEPARTVGGRTNGGALSTYGNMADMLKDMKDPRYNTDTTEGKKLRAAVEAKLARSNI